MYQISWHVHGQGVQFVKKDVFTVYSLENLVKRLLDNTQRFISYSADIAKLKIILNYVNSIAWIDDIRVLLLFDIYWKDFFLMCVDLYRTYENKYFTS